MPSNPQPADGLPTQGQAATAPSGLSPKDFPSAIEPLYTMASPNETVRLYDGRLELRSKAATVSGVGSVQMTWLPGLEVTYELRDARPHSLAALFAVDSELVLVDRAASAKALCTQISDVVRGVANGRLAVGPEHPAKSLIFHIANLTHIHGDGVHQREVNRTTAGRIVLSAGGWRITIDPVAGLSEKLEQVKSSGGYILSHVGLLQRADGGVFMAADAQDVLSALTYCLSFARGFWVAPLLAVTQDVDGKRGQEEWGARLSDPWRSGHTWFSDRHREILPTLFPGFMKRWSQPHWQDALKKAIWWYLAALKQGAGMDGGVILAQVALELLSWVVHVEDGHIISARGFDELAAADKLRLLLAWMKCPQQTPVELPALAAFGQSSVPYGPCKFTEVRNALVHPKNRDKLHSTDVVIQAWDLGLWYTELAILRACDYVGPYMNRLRAEWVGTVEQVPWA